MYKKIKRLVLIAGITLTSIAVHAQQELYYSMKFSKENISMYLSMDHFSKFVLSYEEMKPGYFVLMGAAFNTSGSIIGQPLQLETVDIPKPRPLKNLFKGTLTITLASMTDNGVDGTSDIYFVPKRFHEGKGDELNYVSYRVFNKPVKQTIILVKFPGKVFRVFDVNPSPPG